MFYHIRNLEKSKAKINQTDEKQDQTHLHYLLSIVCLIKCRVCKLDRGYLSTFSDCCFYSIPLLNGIDEQEESSFLLHLSTIDQPVIQVWAELSSKNIQLDTQANYQQIDI